MVLLVLPNDDNTTNDDLTTHQSSIFTANKWGKTLSSVEVTLLVLAME
jgi:hypothetical protein